METGEELLPPPPKKTTVQNTGGDGLLPPPPKKKLEAVQTVSTPPSPVTSASSTTPVSQSASTEPFEQYKETIRTSIKGEKPKEVSAMGFEVKPKEKEWTEAFSGSIDTVPTAQDFGGVVDKGKEEKGNRLGYWYNGILEGIGGGAAGAADLVFQLGAKIFPRPEGVSEEDAVKTLRDELTPSIRGGAKQLAGAEVSQAKEKQFDEEFLTSTIKGVTASSTAMTSLYGTGLFFQAYDSGLESINNTEKGKDLPETTKTIFAGTVGAAQGALEKYGLSKIFGKGSTKVANDIAIKTLTDLIKKGEGQITKEVYEAALDATAKSLKNRVIQVGKAGLTEFETGSLQELSTILAEKGVNKATGESIFEPKSWGEDLGRILYAGGQEAVGGFVLGTAGQLSPSSPRNYISEKVANAKSDEDIAALKQEIQGQFQSGKMSEQAANEAVGLVDKYVAINSKIPADVTNRAQVADLIAEKEEVQQAAEAKLAEAEKVDEAFKPAIQKEAELLQGRVEEINKEIVNPKVSEKDGITQEEIAIDKFAQERKQVDDLFGEDWDGLSDKEMNDRQDRLDVVRWKTKELFTKKATKEEKKQHAKLAKQTIGERLKGNKHDAFARSHNYMEDVVDRIVSDNYKRIKLLQKTLEEPIEENKAEKQTIAATPMPDSPQAKVEESKPQVEAAEQAVVEVNEEADIAELESELLALKGETKDGVSSQAEGESKLKEETKPKKVTELTDKARKQFEDAGFKLSNGSLSETDFGTSSYFYVERPDGTQQKVRVSDHSVENPSRMKDEVHINMQRQDIDGAIKETKERIDNYSKNKEVRDKIIAEETQKSKEKEVRVKEKWEQIKPQFEGQKFAVNERTYQSLDEFKKKVSEAKNIIQTPLDKGAFRYEYSVDKKLEIQGSEKPSSDYIENFNTQDVAGVSDATNQVAEPKRTLPAPAQNSEGRQFAVDYVLADLVDTKPVREKLTKEQSEERKKKSHKTIRKHSKDISQRIDWKMKNEERVRAVRDIKNGKFETTAAKMLLDRLEQMHDNGAFDFIAGTGGFTTQAGYVPIADVKAHLAEVKALKAEVMPELPEEVVAYFANEDALLNEFIDAIEADEVNETNINQQTKNLQDENERTKERVAKENDGDSLSEQQENNQAQTNKVLTEKEQAQREFDEARAAFRKARGKLDTGGLSALPEFINLVKSAIKLGYVTAKDIVAHLKSLDPTDDVTEQDVEEVLNKSNDKTEKKENTPQEPQADNFDQKPDRETEGGIQNPDGAADVGGKKKKVVGRAHEGEFTPDEVKAILEEIGLTRSVKSVEEAIKLADEIIKRLGLDRAIDEVRAGRITESEAAIVMGRAIDYVHNAFKAAKADGNQEYMEITAQMEADLLNELDQMNVSAGRFTGVMSKVYQMSPLGYKKYARKKLENANEATLEKFQPQLDALKKQVEASQQEAADLLEVNIELKMKLDALQGKKSTTTLTPEKAQRKAELRAKGFGSRYNDITTFMTLLADKEAMEYIGLAFEEAKGDFKVFARDVVKNVGKKLKEHLPKLWKKFGGKESDIEFEPHTALIKKLKDKIKGLSKELQEKAIANIGKVNKGLWGKYKDRSAERLAQKITSGMFNSEKKSKPILQEFADELTKNILGMLPKSEQAAMEKKSAIEVIADALKNVEKYREVLEQTKTIIEEKINPNEEWISEEETIKRQEQLLQLDEMFGGLYDTPFSQSLLGEAIDDIIGKSINQLAYLKDKGFDTSSFKQEVIEKLIYQTGLTEEQAKKLIEEADVMLTLKQEDAETKLSERKEKAAKKREEIKQKIKTAAIGKVNKPKWNTRKQNATDALIKKLESSIFDKLPKQRTALEEFATRLKANLSSSAKEELGVSDKKTQGQSPTEMIAEILRNRDKYEDVIKKTQNELIEKYKDSPIVLMLFDDALFKIADKPFNTSLVEKSVNEGLQELYGDEVNKKLIELAKEYYKEGEKVKGKLVDFLVEKTGLDAEMVEPYAKALEEVYDKLLNKKVQNLIEKTFPLPRVIERKKALKEHERIVQAINVGLKTGKRKDGTPFNFAKEFYAKLGMIDVNDPAINEKLNEFADKIYENRNEDNPLYKNMATIHLLDWIANRQQESRLQEGIIEHLYANMLYGEDTHIRNTVYNTQVVIGAMLRQIIQNPKYTKLLLNAFAKSWSQGVVEMKNVIMTGMPKSGSEVKARQFGERAKDINGFLNVWTKYVNKPSRMLQAFDALGNFPLRKSRVAFLLIDELKKSHPNLSTSFVAQEVNKVLYGTDVQAAQWRQTAEQQTQKYYGLTEPLFIDGKRNPVYADKKYNEAYRNNKRSFYNLQDANLKDESIFTEAKDYSDTNFLMSKPKGYFGVGAHLVNELGTMIPFGKVLTTPFVNVPFNIAANIFEYSPLGFLTTIAGKEGKGVNMQQAKRYGIDTDFTERRRQELLYKAILGSTAMLAIKAITMLTYDDDEEGERPVLIVMADGTGNYIENKKLEKLEGSEKFQEYTIDFMGARISYKYSPYAALFLYAGFTMDAERYGDKGYEVTPSQAEKMAKAWAGFFIYMKDQSSLSGLADLLNLGERSGFKKESTLDKGTAMAEKFAGKTLRNLTTPNFIPQTYRHYKGIFDLEESVGSDFLSTLAKDIPFADQFVDKRYDHFGRTINSTWKVPGIYNNPQDDDPIYQLMRDKKYIDKVRYFRDSKIELDNKTYPLNQQQIDDISKLRATYAGQEIKRLYPQLTKLNDKDFADVVNTIFTEAKHRAVGEVGINPEEKWLPLDNELAKAKIDLMILENLFPKKEKPVKEKTEEQVEKDKKGKLKKYEQEIKQITKKNTNNN